MNPEKALIFVQEIDVYIESNCVKLHRNVSQSKPKTDMECSLREQR